MGFYDLRNCVFGNHPLGSDRPIGMNPSQRRRWLLDKRWLSCAVTAVRRAGLTHPTERGSASQQAYRFP